MLYRLTLTLSILWCALAANAQLAPFNVYLQPVTVNGLGGLQAYAYVQHNGKWLIAGGRLDGLHRRQPFASFDVAGNNNRLIVVDPVTQQTWSVDLTTLPVAMQEQLSSTNMEFYQEGNYLYIIGGYGYNAATASRKTFASLMAIDVPQAIAAVINGTSLVPYFRQVTDNEWAVTGGHLKKMYGVYYLAGGNRFDGNYNPMGNPTYTQVYTDAVRRFTLTDNGTTITVNHLPAYTDAANLHRRDYNAVPQIMPDGTEGFTMFSGVFQPTVDLPFLNCVNIDSNGYTVNNNFQQYYNHYHCAVLPLYSATANEMHSVFFGGIAQYFDSAGVLVQDNNVPFVNTIARVTRQANGTMAEYKLPEVMPSLLGAGAEFIPELTVPHYVNEVFKLDELTDDTTMVGYIFGGISSTAPNIFFSNTGTQSVASNQVFKVLVVKPGTTGIHQLNTHSTGTLKMQVFPNPNSGNFHIRFNMAQQGRVVVRVYSAAGQVLHQKNFAALAAGEHTYSPSLKQPSPVGIYFVTIETATETASQKIIVEP